MEEHPLPQGNGCGQPVAAEFGQLTSQFGLDRALLINGIERIAQGADQLQRDHRGGLGWIDAVDGAIGRNHQRGLAGGCWRPATRQQHQAGQ